jgi:hypothetical protein
MYIAYINPVLPDSNLCLPYGEPVIPLAAPASALDRTLIVSKLRAWGVVTPILSSRPLLGLWRTLSWLRLTVSAAADFVGVENTLTVAVVVPVVVVAVDHGMPSAVLDEVLVPC